MTAHLDRAVLLFEQSRHDLAEQELRQELAANPGNAMAHALLALSVVQSGRHDEATREAREAIHLAPDLPFAHYAMAGILHERNQLDESRAAIEEAIRLDPERPEYYARLSAIWFDKRRWREALSVADRGLALDPEHPGCTNLRAMALVRLGRGQQAADTIDAALARDPENALSHANQGWTLLHRAEYPRALEHFREALRLDPELDWAREGIVEALKARYAPYGLMLRYFLWMSRLSGRAQWAIILGGVFGYRMLRNLARSEPALAPLIWPILILYAGFVFLTWTADPLFNLVLRLNRFGRLALSREQTVASNWVGASLLVSLVALGGWAVTRSESALFAAFLAGAMVLPLSVTFRCRPGWPRKLMAAYSVFLAAAGMAALLVSPFAPANGISQTLFAISIVGALLSSWASLFMARLGHKG